MRRQQGSPYQPKTSTMVRLNGRHDGLVPTLPYDAMVTFGAGEHTNWVHRYFPTHHYGSLISAATVPWGTPSIGGCRLAGNPNKIVVTVAGDGEF